MKRLDISLLQRGDIILAGYPDDTTSQMICRFTKSKYSHAMLYWDSSLLHSIDAIVTSDNPSREIYGDNYPVCILRLKPDYYDPAVIDKAINFARRKVGTLYDKDALKRIVRGETIDLDNNREFCSKFVAESYENGGISLVDNPNTCSPESIHVSDKLYIVSDNPLLEADDKYVEWAQSPNVLQDQYYSTCKLLFDVREYTNEDIVTIEQIVDYLVKHKEADAKLSQLFIDSGYLTLWQKEEEMNPENYDMDMFEKKYGPYAKDMAESVINDGHRIAQFSRAFIRNLERINSEYGPLDFIRLYIELHENIINQADKRNQALCLLTFCL